MEEKLNKLISTFSIIVFTIGAGTQAYCLIIFIPFMEKEITLCFYSGLMAEC